MADQSLQRLNRLEDGNNIKYTKNQSQLSDDGDYNVSEERYGGGVADDGDGMEVQLRTTEYNTEEVDMNSPDSPKKIITDSAHATHESNHNNDDDDDANNNNNPPSPFGSSVSSAEKYADRNSDPGIHLSEKDLLPVLPGGQYTMEGGLYDEQGNPPPLPRGGGGGDGQQTNIAAAGGAGGGGGGVPPGSGGGAAGPTGNESVSLGTATQTHEVRMPMLLSTFKPATGCTNASDFIVRCFVARLRSGITVVKHGRSRWCKSRLRVLHVHPDGRSLSWKPALGEPSSGKRPPKLDLTTCREVRHAWSPDPDNPMFTGTPILRQKCEAANAHKSFALIFPKRTVDITAVTADQCKVLMEGFSALCFRLQVAQNVAGSGDGKNKGETSNEEDRATASVTASNMSDKGASPKFGKKR
ncbi:hypothetical protein ACHAWC_009880 [Mediolabrus comicus]